MKRSALWIFLVMILCSCVERRLVIVSDPPGARVYLDTVPRGFTPLTLHFPHYGIRKVVLDKPDYHKASQIVTLKAPWYERYGLSFFADVVVPWMIRDVHHVNLTLTPFQGRDVLLEERAEVAKKKLENFK